MDTHYKGRNLFMVLITPKEEKVVEQNSLQVFAFDGCNVRVVMKDGIPWFVAKDVCTVLGIKNARDAVARALDADEKGVAKTDTLGGEQEMTIINESGLYTLIMRSIRPDAKRFRKWVTSEVLPAIRQTGSYSIPVRLSAEEIELRYAELEVKRQEVANAKSALLRDLVLQFQSTLSPVALESMVACATNTLVGSEVVLLPEVEQLYTATQIGEMLGISKQKVGQIANQFGLKTEQNGHTVLDKAANCNKQVEVFRYNRDGVEAIKEAYQRSLEEE